MHHDSKDRPFYCKSKEKAIEYMNNTFESLENTAKSIPDHLREQKLRNLRKTKKNMINRLDVFKGIKC